MTFLKRLILILIVLLTWGQTSYGGIILFDERVDAQQITELRFDVPAGCVVTGLGFRAHYDNVTTMHCRYHRLAANGKLTDPKEVHLGSEPDHACEAKVMLPEGWVMVGFGAAGEPEWDVTLLRVWARRLNADGSLGEMKAFSDGFKPDRGTERDVLLTESDRALTGVGLRFGSNDITGVYARSRRIIAIDEKTSKRLKPFKVRGWLLDGVDASRLSILTKDMKKYGVKRLDIHLTLATKAINDPDQLHALKSLVTSAGACNVETYLRIDSNISNNLKWLFKQVPGLTGVVADLTSLHIWTPESKKLKEFQEICRKAKRKLCLRVDPSNYTHRQIVRKMPQDTSILVSWMNVSSATSDLTKLGRRDVIVEIGLVDQAAASINLPDVRINHLASQLAGSLLAGANGFAARINTGNRYVTDTVNSLMPAALNNLADDPFQPTESLWDELCTTHYGAAGPQAKAALQQASAAGDLIFGSLGLRFLWLDGRIAPVNIARNRLQKWLAQSSEGQKALSIQKLLAPTDKVTRETELEKETTVWLIRQSIANAKKAAELNPSPQTQLLCTATERLQQIAEFSKAVTQIYMYTQLYAQDAAPKTRQTTEAMLEKLPALADQTSKAMGDNTICRGIDEFIASARASLKESEQNSPLASAFRRVRELSSAGRDDAAVQGLVDIMQSTAFGPHLSKHNVTIGEVASSLNALMKPSDTFVVMRHGDGQWLIKKVGGRWCWSIGPPGKPCLYLDVPAGPLKKSADYVLPFEYFDKGDWKIHFHYDSAYLPPLQREYHPAEPIQLTNTGKWKNGSFILTNCRFGSGQNDGADMRFVSGKGACIRNIRLQRK